PAGGPAGPREAGQAPGGRRRDPERGTLVRRREIVVPAGDRRVTSCGAGVAQVRAAAPDAGVVEATRGAGVVRVILLCIDVARQIGAGVDGPEIRDPAVYGPGGGLRLVLFPSRHDGNFLQ